VRILVLSRDLILASRILAEASATGQAARLVSEPIALPPPVDVDLLFVNWADRDPGWAAALLAWRDRVPPSASPTLVLYGPHTDIEAHAEARSAGLGPVLARSKLVADLPELLRVRDDVAPEDH